MRRLACIATLLIAALARAQDTRPGDLVPVEVGVADMNTMSTSLKQMPVELNETTNFTRLYGVAGRPDLFVRSHGGMYAVFDQGQYVTVRKQNSSRTFATWPSGTTFYIGRPDFTKLQTAGIRKGVGTTMLSAPGIDVHARKVNSDQVDGRGPDSRDGSADSKGPVDARVADSRIGGTPINDQNGARVKGGTPGYGTPASRADAAAQPAPPREAHAVPPQPPVPADATPTTP
jgi:hypothetical protein